VGGGGDSSRSFFFSSPVPQNKNDNATAASTSRQDIVDAFFISPRTAHLFLICTEHKISRELNFPIYFFPTRLASIFDKNTIGKAPFDPRN
jgi:hypothetical protein